ncbi:MAG TPA: O-antigen ligase family protein [Anaerolineales bacterium]|nr:O-antigen ligase family protein [Anaerolineales bacterium]
MDWLTPETFRRVERILWAAVLVTLPVTSFRYLPFMGSDTQVKPLSLLPAALLLLVLILRSLRERRLILWSRTYTPLLVFILVALISTAVGYYLAPVKLYSFTYSGRVLRAWLSLAVGLVFLVVPVCVCRSEEDLEFTLKWLYIGLIPEFAWSLLQLLNSLALIRGLDKIQKMVMMAGLPPNHRISGLALEPSWLAAQVMTLYLPWAFASMLKGYGWPKRRWVAPVILAVCAFLLLFTYSRGGILTAVGAVILTFVVAGWDRIRQAWAWMVGPFQSKKGLVSKAFLAISIRLAVIVAVVAGLAGGVFILSRNNYFAQLWQSRKTNLVAYLVDIYAGPRLAYSWAGWTIFSQHPLTGVGLGAAGFTMQKNLPDWAHFNISEIAQLLSSDNTLYPNVKDLYVRLLAETGIVGFWAFLAFYLLILGKILGLFRSQQKLWTFLGAASLLAWIGIVVLGITQDTLAMPNIWLPFGILIGMIDAQERQ